MKDTYFPSHTLIKPSDCLKTAHAVKDSLMQSVYICVIKTTTNRHEKYSRFVKLQSKQA